MVGVIAVVASVALVAAPGALANGDTIAATVAVQFSGVVDSGASCAPAAGTTPTIQWGDGTSSNGTYDSTTDSVSGSHTYATGGALTGHVTLTNPTSCVPNPTTDNFTANVASYNQCPPVDHDTGCQFLVVTTNSGATILTDSTQTAYDDGGDDALIGVQNNGSAPISSIPLNANPGLFGFEQDGLCDPGTAPVPSGCAVIGGTGGCGTGAVCAFPKPPGQPPGYTEPGALSGSTQNGYEGPTSYFTNIFQDQHSGVIHFSPAIPPGGSSYFSLEEPPVGSLTAGGSPGDIAFSAPPTVTATGASFSAFVNPNGSPTTATFQYGLDLKYSKRAASGPNYTNSTPVQNVGTDFSDHLMAAQVSGLVPNALYHARLAATNAGGTTFGPDITFMTSMAPAPGAPILGRTFNLQPVSGLVLIRVNGVLIPLTQLRQFPRNTEIDALDGTVQIITALPGHPAADAAAKKHKGKGKGKVKPKVKTQSGTFGGAIFKISQASNGLATLTLVENAFTGAPSYASCGKGKKGKAADATIAAGSSKTLQLLHSSAKGKFATKGKYAAATVRGTKWTIADRCDGTLTHDITDSVAVTDFVHHKTIVLHAGQSYLAKKP